MITMGMGSDGSGLDVSVVLSTKKLPVAIKELDPIKISTDTKLIKVNMKNMQIGLDLKQEIIKTNIKDC